MTKGRNPGCDQTSSLAENIEYYNINQRKLNIFIYDPDNFVTDIIKNKLSFLYKKFFFKLNLDTILLSQQAMDVHNDTGDIFVKSFS